MLHVCLVGWLVGWLAGSCGVSWPLRGGSMVGQGSCIIHATTANNNKLALLVVLPVMVRHAIKIIIIATRSPLCDNNDFRFRAEICLSSLLLVLLVIRFACCCCMCDACICIVFRQLVVQQYR